MNATSAHDHLGEDLSMSFDDVRPSLLGHERSNPPADLPERRLMVALVRDAIRCIEKYRTARDTRGKRLFAKEAQWMLSDDDDSLYAFVRVCETLDLNPDAVRHSLGLVSVGDDDRSNRGADALSALQ
jgi:hypothetical protein